MYLLHSREYGTPGSRRTRIGSRRPSNSRRFQPSRPQQNGNPVFLRRLGGEGQIQEQAQENWSSSQGETLQENWGLQEQTQENWFPENDWSQQQQQEEPGRFYDELKWRQGGEGWQQREEGKFEPLTQRLGGQRNPRSSFF